MKIAPRVAAPVLALALAALLGTAHAGDVTKVPAFDQFLVVPLRVHVVVSPELDLTDTKITDAEVAKVVGNINTIWSRGGIAFHLEAIVREPAGQSERFQTVVKLNNGEFPNTDPFALLLPLKPSRMTDGVHLYIVHKLPLNGFYIAGADAAVVKETADVRQVKGGSKDPVARVAARFLGEAIGLPPGRDDEVGLASGGTNGVGLSELEIGRVRQVARTVPGVLEVDDLAKLAADAAKARETDKARRIYTTLAAIPGAGPGAADARKQLAALPPAAK